MSGQRPAEAGILNRPAKTQTPSTRLRRKIQLVTGPFAEACHNVFTHPRLRELWPEYMITQHTIIRSTVPLMQAGLDRARAMANADPVAAGVADYLDVHIMEETNHDEWLLDDLEVLGVPRAAALARVPSATVAALVGSQYYWLFHYHPVAVLGYFAFMEGFPPKPELILDLSERGGLPQGTLRTFALHGELDPGHQEELDLAIDALPLTAEQETILGLSALSTGVHVTQSLQDVARTFTGDSSPADADWAEGAVQ